MVLIATLWHMTRGGGTVGPKQDAMVGETLGLTAGRTLGGLRVTFGPSLGVLVGETRGATVGL
jgi:uncharacterized protein YqgC (DUF456 family)